MRRALIALLLLAWCGTASAQSFSVGQFVTNNFTSTINRVHLTPVIPTPLPFNPAVPIINIVPVVTSGIRPLVIGGSPCTVTLYGLGSDGSVYDVSSAAYTTIPQVVQFTPGVIIPNEPVFNFNTVLQLGYTQGSGNRLVGMSFTEQAPPVYSTWAASTAQVKGNQIQDSNGNIEQVTAITGDATTGSVAPTWPSSAPPPYLTTSDNNVIWTIGGAAATPATNIQVTSIVVFTTPLSNGSLLSFAFNDLVNTLQAGLTPPPAQPTYDMTTRVLADPPYTEFFRNVPQASLMAAP